MKIVRILTLLILLFLKVSVLCAPVLGADMRVCLCLCAQRVKMTPRSPAVNHTVVT